MFKFVIRVQSINQWAVKNRRQPRKRVASPCYRQLTASEKSRFYSVSRALWYGLRVGTEDYTPFGFDGNKNAKSVNDNALPDSTTMKPICPVQPARLWLARQSMGKSGEWVRGARERKDAWERKDAREEKHFSASPRAYSPSRALWLNELSTLVSRRMENNQTKQRYKVVWCDVTLEYSPLSSVSWCAMSCMVNSICFKASTGPGAAPFPLSLTGGVVLSGGF